MYDKEEVEDYEELCGLGPKVGLVLIPVRLLWNFLGFEIVTLNYDCQKNTRKLKFTQTRAVFSF